MATLTRGYTFGTTETVTAAKLHSLVDSATISGIVAADLAAGAVSGAKILMGSDTRGDLLYFNGTAYARLPAGTSGQFLKSGGTGADPSWDTPSGLATFATPTVTLSSTASEGALGTTLRSDCVIAAFDATLPVSLAIGDSAATGDAAFAARRNHVHGMPSFGTPALVFSTSNSAGVATTPLRSDAQIALFDATAPVTQAFGDSAATGSAGTAARRDHKHGMPAGGSGGIGNFTDDANTSISTSSSYADATNVTRTFTPTAATNVIQVVVSGRCRTNGGSGEGYLKLLVDGSEVMEWSVGAFEGVAANEGFNIVGVYLTQLSAASHTLKVQHKFVGTGTPVFDAVRMRICEIKG